VPIRPETRYVETADGFVAYQVFGGGPRDILFATNALTNLDVIWDEPSAARFLDRLGTMGRVVHFDMIGSGVSDPIPDRSTWLPIESYAEHVVAVLDAAGMDTVDVYGDTEGGFFSIMLAALRPERVRSLVLVNAMARILRSAEYPIGIPPDVSAVLAQRYPEQHGTTGDVLDLTAPSVANDPRFRTWWTRYQRLCIPLGLVSSTWEWFTETDVRAALPVVQAPTLVISRRDARYHRPAHGEFLAEHIPHARLVVLEGGDTLPFHAGDVGPVLDLVEEFLTGTMEPTPTHRKLATVLISDIVGSTEQASALGDERWLDTLADHDRIVESQVARFGGRVVKMTGDGCLATFDGPARAIECAASMTELLGEIGLVVRTGIHTGEIEERGTDIGGVAVHIAARVMDAARRGGILVSGTVKDLVVGSPLAFISCGTTELRGVPGEWALYEVSTARP